MTKEDCEEKLVLLYQHFYRKIHNQPNYKFQSQPNHEKTIENFFQTLSKLMPIQGLGDGFLINYMGYSWLYWVDKETKRKVSFNWVVGDKSLDRWLTRHEAWEYHTSLNVFQKYKIRKDELKGLLSPVKRSFADIRNYEEVEKRRWWNTDVGFFHCIETTSLYHPKSANCKTCKFAKDCKELLRVNYPAVYKERIDDGVKRTLSGGAG